jgi:hypothetical protein
MAVSAAVALLTPACLGGDQDADGQQFTGAVVAVRGDDAVRWDAITVRDSTGRELIFARGEGVDLRFWRATHLREHMLSAAPVKVTYRQSSQGLVATRLDD